MLVASPPAGVDILQDSYAVPRGEVGDIVCTGLLNRSMPLISYRLGNREALEAKEDLCACGRRLPTFARIEGRTEPADRSAIAGTEHQTRRRR